MNLDRFSVGLKDPQESKVMCYCEACGGEIYEESNFYFYERDIIHQNQRCVEQYFGLQKGRFDNEV